MPTRKPSILVVDDDPRILKLMKRDLQLEGYWVTTATGGRMALQLIEDEEPDLVILDIMCRPSAITRHKRGQFSG